MCKCGIAHWSHEPHGWATSKNPGAPRVDERAKPSVEGTRPADADGATPEVQSGRARSQASERSAGRHSRKPVTRKAAKAGKSEAHAAPPSQLSAPASATSPARKDYLKKKAVERRKREREEADRLGLTVKAYRATKRKQNDGRKDQQLQTGQDDG